MVSTHMTSAICASFAMIIAAPCQAQEQNQGPPYSPVIEANGVIYLAGHLGRIPGTSTYPEGGTGPQTTQALTNIGATLDSVGASHADIVRCQVFLTEISDFSEMNDAYRPFFPETPPARTTVEASALAGGAMVEIECTAVRGHSSRLD